MGLETASYINQLDAANPGASDQVSQGDDHLRLIKSVLKTQFSSLGNAPVNATAAQMNHLIGVTSAIQDQLDNLIEALYLYDLPANGKNFLDQPFWIDQSDRRQWFYVAAANSTFSNVPWNTTSAPSAITACWINRRNSINTDSYFHTVYVLSDQYNILIPYWRAGKDSASVLLSKWVKGCAREMNVGGTETGVGNCT